MFALDVIANLPEELLEYILRQVKDSATPETFWNCLRTCRQWHRIGLGLYKGLGFAVSATVESDSRRCNVQDEPAQSDYHLYYALSLNPPSQLYCSLLKSLTIHVRHQRIATPFAASYGNDLASSLGQAFSSMELLTVFSLRFSDGWNSPSLDVPAVPQSMLARLVEALPETVISLELDTAGTDIPPSAELIATDSSGHLCYQLGRILTRLRCLRLRVGHVCGQILALQSDAPCCHYSQSCDHCMADEQATCTLLRIWKMRSMAVWLPWGQTADNNSFAQASKALMDPTLRNPTTMLFVYQKDHKHPHRTSLTEPESHPYRLFDQRIQSNVSTALRKRLGYFRFNSICGTTFLSNRPRQTAIQRKIDSCDECKALLEAPKRRYMLTSHRRHVPEAGATSAYAYIAEQTIEHMLSWMQSSHLGYRFPMPEADEPEKPFWKTPDRWVCLFPGCKVRSKTLVHLRGHHMYAHPAFPHHNWWEGCEPCPSLGCDRVGGNGFKSLEDLEEHLLGHHLRPCTRVKGEEASDSVLKID